MSRRKLAALGLVSTLGLALVGCRALDQDYSDELGNLGTVTEIALRGGAGSVVIEPASGSDVGVKRHFRYGGDRPKGRDRLDGSVLRIDTACGHDCSVDYVVSVPTAVPVTGSTGSGPVSLQRVGAVALSIGSGSISLRGASGDVSVQTGSGEITVQDVTGAVTARTGSGSIRVHRVSGVVVAEAGSGEVDVADTGGDHLTLRTGSGAISVVMTKLQTVRAVADSGEIRVMVPAGLALDVSAVSDSGEARIGVPVTAGAPNRLDLQTDSGDITVAVTR
jgi:hypothetical protein